MRMRLTRVSVALAASAAMMTGLAASVAATTTASRANAAAPVAQAAAACRHHVIAYVTTGYGNKGTVTPVDTVTGATLKPIPVGRDPEAIVVTPDGRMAYVANKAPGSVTVIRTRTGTVVKTIPVPGPQGMTTVIGITPNGKTVYVSFGVTVVPIRTADYKVLKPITTGVAVTGMVLTPDSRKLYVASWNGKVLPIGTATNTMGKPIVLQSYSIGVTINTALSPNGRTLYAVSTNTLTLISTATDKAGKPIRLPEWGASIVAARTGGPHTSGSTTTKAPMA